MTALNDAERAAIRRDAEGAANRGLGVHVERAAPEQTGRYPAWLAFGGLMLLGGRLGDTIGRKRTFIVGVALFTIASILCGIAWDETTLVTARLLHGVGAASSSPTGLALVATTFRM